MERVANDEELFTEEGYCHLLVTNTSWMRVHPPQILSLSEVLIEEHVVSVVWGLRTSFAWSGLVPSWAVVPFGASPSPPPLRRYPGESGCSRFRRHLECD